MYDIIIIGSGPAGLTSAIYAGRAGLNSLILDKSPIGGTANTAPLVENYPGFEKITGSELMENMKQQATNYCEIKEFTNVKKITKKDSIFTVETSNGNFTSKYIILATGTTHKSLDAEGIKEFTGRGVSYCAVCDGNFFVDQEVLVVGGGNSAATEALYLNRIGVKVSLVHRRNKLRCDAKLQEDLEKNNIKIYWDCVVKEVKGELRVDEAVLLNKVTGEEINVKVSGIFVAIGHNPNNQLAVELGVDCDDSEYIKVDKDMKTNVDNVFAAGDITGVVKQIIVSSGQGAVAASKIQSLML